MGKGLIIFKILLIYVISVQAQGDLNKKFKMEKFNVDTSVRAIEVFNDSILWFAGSQGKFGRVINNKLEIDSIAFDEKHLNFRSIASNGKDVFFMSIENPAIMYKKNALTPTSDRPYIVYGEGHEKVFYDSMQFFNKKNGIAIGDPTQDCLSIILSTDGGNQWRKIQCEDLPSTIEGEAAFAASNSNIATYKKNAWVVSGGNKARVFHTNNYGKTWNVYDTPITQGSNMSGIFTVDFFDEKNGIIMGGNWEEKSNTNQTKAITKDGGKTWELIANNKAPGYISCVQYIPDTEGKELMAVSTEGIFQSKDYGQNWIKLSDEQFYTIRFIDKNNAWLAGNNILAKLELP